MPKAPKGLMPGEVLGQHGKAGAMVKIKPGTYHRHGCQQCGLRYDDACQTPGENGRCISCRTAGEKERPLWITSMDPRPCCQAPKGSRQMTYDERARYACATAIIWYICKTCARTHPYDPTKPEGAPA